LNKRLKKKLDQSLISSNKSTVVSLANSHIVDIIGINNENLEYAEEHLSVQILQKGNIIIIKGNKKDRYVLRDTIIQLSEELKVPNLKYKNSFKEILNMKIKNDKENQNIKNLTVAKTTRTSVTGKTPQQNQYLEALYSKQIVFGVGPAGTGKTYLAVAAAVAQLLDGKYDRIILSRPAVEAGEKLGFLPGDIKEKVDPYLRPFYDAIHELLPPDEALRKIESSMIEIAPLAFMRGRTLNNAFVILDEAQNATSTQIKMFLTRCGKNTRMVVNGDPSQIDLPNHIGSGLNDSIEALKLLSEVGIVNFSKRDIVRDEIISKILDAYDNHSNFQSKSLSSYDIIS
jgi:phosphate starvation-inducible PhoH-like protein|tara:strand:+ start:435 stop:1463 length:1029 start_codon:yes stop_codon:yes gene_type:complete